MFVNSESLDSLYPKIPPVILHQLQAHQTQHQLPDLDAAIIHILEQFFDEALALPADAGVLAEDALTEVNQRLACLSRELVNVRMQVPQEYDRLREQLAAVRLSHSGLLHNLRERIEMIEKTIGLADIPPN